MEDKSKINPYGFNSELKKKKVEKNKKMYVLYNRGLLKTESKASFFYLKHARNDGMTTNIIHNKLKINGVTYILEKER